MTTAHPALVLSRTMESPIAPTWAGAVWIGEVDVADVPTEGVIGLIDAAGHATARLLVREGRVPVGFVDVAITTADGIASIDAGALRAGLEALPAPGATLATLHHHPDITVVICTRDRADQLRGALASVLELDYPNFDVLVVDNAPATEETRELVLHEFTDARLRYVREPVAGLSSARNTGLLAATGSIVAYTDDDVVVDRLWLQGVAAGFARGEDVVCVTGLVPSGELRTPTQAFFDSRVSWSRNLEPRTFRLAEPPADLPLFPFSVGAYGTGANVSVRRKPVIAMGGFDTAFGVGTRTGGGEDLDMFTRVLFAGYALVVEPSALVWHRHRSDLGGLRVQAVGYGTGLGAWLTKVVFDRQMFGAAIARAPRAVKHLLGGSGAQNAQPAQNTQTSTPVVPAVESVVPADDSGFAGEVSRVRWTELASVGRGPWRYLRQRRDGAGLLDPSLRGAARRPEVFVSSPATPRRSS